MAAVGLVVAALVVAGVGDGASPKQSGASQREASNAPGATTRGASGATTLDGVPARGARGSDDVVADDLAEPLRDGWRRDGSVKLRARRTRDGRALELSGRGAIARALPARTAAVSIDVNVPRRGALALGFGRGDRLVLRRSRAGTLSARSGSWRVARIAKRRGWGPGGWRHLELSTGARPRLAIDGRRLGAPVAPGDRLALRPLAGRPRVAALVATVRGDRGALLLHRLAELHARVPRGQFPFGQGSPGGRLHLSDGWTSGFMAGSLWRGFDLSGSRLFRGWALAATVDHLGRERERIHDQGFRYLESSAAAYDRTCRGERTRTRICRRLRRSALTASDTLLRLQRGNARAGTIPTLPKGRRCGVCRSRNEAETIVDSMMNISLLDWAHARTGLARYRTASLRHARGVARMLVRRNGSTAQAVRIDRRTGRPIRRETRQGISRRSTWSRGQGWAIYGFAATGAALRDAKLVAVSERAARYAAANLPAGGVPRWDYAARPGAPIDTSAGVITAAGLFRLADACERLAGTCREAERWRPLARRMLAASLRRVRTRAPLGYLGRQVFARGGHARWDDEGDFVFGTDYALEAVARSGA